MSETLNGIDLIIGMQTLKELDAVLHCKTDLPF